MLEVEGILREPTDEARFHALDRLDFGLLTADSVHALAGDPSWWVRSHLAECLLREKASEEVTATRGVYPVVDEISALLNSPRIPHQILSTFPSGSPYNPEVAVVNARGVGLRMLQFLFDPLKNPPGLVLTDSLRMDIASELNRRQLLRRLDLSVFSNDDITRSVERNLENPAGVVSEEDLSSGNARISGSTQRMFYFAASVTLVYFHEKLPHLLTALEPMRNFLVDLKGGLIKQPPVKGAAASHRWGELVAIQNNRQSEALGILATGKAYLEFCFEHYQALGLDKSSMDRALKLYRVLIPPG